MIHVMHDLETLGTDPGCVILSIGAITFDPHGMGLSFYQTINRQTCYNAGLTDNPATLEWWRRQSEEARKVLTESQELSTCSLGIALFQFTEYLNRIAGAGGINNVKIWGNGADFDKPILGTAYKMCGFNQPWAPYNGGCYRTLKNLRPEIKLIRSGTAHNALIDAIDQAKHAIALLNDVKGW